MEYRTVSLADRVFESLEYSILSGKYKKGEIISEKRLCSELGVSRTPIREALSRLQEEDLISDSPSGTVVLGMTLNEIRDVYEVKRRVEVLASERAARHITDKELKHMREILDQQEYYAQKHDVIRLMDLDTEFHLAIYDASRSRIFRKILRSQHKKLMRYRRASVRQNNKRFTESVIEHNKLYDAFEMHDEKLAHDLMLEHVENAAESLNKMNETDIR